MIPSVEERREMEKPQTQNEPKTPNPNTREENGKKRDREEKNKEGTPAPLFPISSRVSHPQKKHTRVYRYGL